MAGEDDLVSNVRVTGIDETNRQFTTLGDAGEKGFDRVGKAAKKAGDDVSAATDKVDKGANQAKQSLDALGRTNLTSLTRVAPDLKQIELGAKNLVTAIRSGIPAIASFVTRLTAAGTAAAAAGVAILKVASNVAAASKTQTSSVDKLTQSQIESNNSSLQMQTGAINLESAQRKLFQQLQSGQITYSEYSKQLQQINLDYKEQQRVSAQVQAATESVRLENERLQKQAADTKAFQKQVDMFGGPLLSSMIQLGNTADALFQRLKQTFGPAIAQGIDLINQALTTNGGAINAFFTEASAKIATFLSTNGPAITLAFETIGTAIRTVFEGIINALPGLLSFFNDSLVPAVRGFGVVLSGIATVINTVFGTQLTAGAIVFLVILGQMTGAFVALINVIRIFAALMSIVIGLPFGPAILLIVAAIGVLLFVFPQLRQVALDVLTSILDAFKGVAAGAAATVQAVIDAFNSLGAFFTNLGVVIVDAFTTAFETLRGLFNQLVAFAKSKLQPILDLLEAISSLVGAALSGNAAGGPVTAAGGGYIRGPGTSTSDSIPALLSDGEFVIKARSAAKYGLGLLHAINSGRFKMPKFNMGGLVSSMIAPSPRLAYADGGEVASSANMRPLNLSLFGEDFKGLLAPDDVGQRLTKFAVSRQNKSAGRKPEWLGRGRN